MQMKFLGFVIGGVILGYLIGSQFGASRAAADAGWLSFLVLDAFQEHYAGRAAIIGGIVGAVIALNSKEE